MRPRLSVVVPFYGVEDYIRQCLESIRDQAMQEIEVILVDDGSLDGSADIAAEFAAADPRFRVVTQANAGLGAARNTGAAESVAEYLTFVDSDDLVTVHGFERLVGSLDTTGSSFAAGNARRFNNSSGVRQSWSHRNAFQNTLLASHIVEFPLLGQDRMIWNKVYRRSFWDEFDMSFPAIRYEDYPVTLKAHVDAVTVDVHAEPVYYWRERESGDSITQQALRYDNILDRVQSAEMVLDIADGSSREVRKVVYDSLVESDLITAFQAFEMVPPEQADQLLALGRRLADRLGEATVSRRHPYDHIQFRALQAGDVELLRQLAAFRSKGGLRGVARARPRPGMPWQMENQFPGLGGSSVPRLLYRVPHDQIGVVTAVTDVTWVDGSLRVRARADIRHLPTSDSARVRVQAGRKGAWRDVPFERFRTEDSHGDPHLVGLEIVLDQTLLSGLAATDQNVQFKVSVTQGRYRRSASLRGMHPGSPTWAGGAWVGPHWAQPAATTEGEFVVSWVRQPWQLAEAAVDGSHLVLTVTTPREVSQAQLVINSSRPSVPPLHIGGLCEQTPDGTRLVARVDVEALVAAVEFDDPFDRVVTTPVQVEADNGLELLVWTAPPQTIGEVHADQLVRLTRSPANRVNVVVGPVLLSGTDARIEGAGDDSVLVVEGVDWDERPDVVFSWRRFLPNSDDYVEAPATSTIDGGRWRVTASVSDLLTTAVEPVPTASPLTPEAEWVLFSAAGREPATSILVEPFLASRLPLTMVDGQRKGILLPKGRTLHLTVTHEPANPIDLRS